MLLDEVARILAVIVGAYIATLGVRLSRDNTGTSTPVMAKAHLGPLRFDLTTRGAGMGVSLLGVLVILFALWVGGPANRDEVIAELYPSKDVESDGVPLTHPEILTKKRVEQALSQVSVTETREVTAAIREESVATLARLVQDTDADETLAFLSDATMEDWNDYAEERRGTPVFLASMLSLRTLGLVVFDAVETDTARITSRGIGVSQYIAAQSSQSRLPRELWPLADPVQLNVDDQAREWEFKDYADHWYSVYIEAPGHYVINTEPPTTSQIDVDTELFLYQAPEEDAIGYDDDGGFGNYSALRVNLLPGTYELRVSSFERTPGSYRLRVIKPEQYDRELAIRSFDGRALPLSADGRVSEGRLPDYADAWYALSIRESGEYAIETTGVMRGSPVDTVVELYSSSACTALGYLDTRLGYAAWRSSYCWRASTGV